MHLPGLIHRQYFPGIKVLLMVVNCIFYLSSLNCQVPTPGLLKDYVPPDQKLLTGYHDEIITTLELDGKGLIFDQMGFCWIATYDGLQRFDSHGTKKYQRILYDTTSPGTNSFFAIFKDKQGVIWLGADSEFYRFNPDDPWERFTRYEFYPNTIVHGFFQDNEGLLWVVGNRGNEICRFDKEAESFKWLTYETINSLWINSIYQDKNETIWIGSEEGLFEYVADKDTFLNYPILTKNPEFNSDIILDILEDSHNRFWVAATTGLFLFDREKGTFLNKFRLRPDLPADSDENIVWAIAEDPENNLWLRVKHGLIKYITGTNETYFFEQPNVLNTNYSLFSFNRNLIVDQENNIWYFHYNALHRLSRKGNQFEWILNDNRSTGYQSVVKGVCEDRDGDLWIAVSTGYGSAQPENPGLYHIRNKDKSIKHNKYVPHQTGSINSDYFSIMYHDDSGNIWLGTSRGLNRIYKTEEQKVIFKTYKADSTQPGNISNSFILYIFKDLSGNLCFAFDKLNMYDYENDRFIQFEHELGLSDSAYTDTCWQKDIKGEIWVPHSSGLYRFIPPFMNTSDYAMRASSVIKYSYDAADSSSISGSFIHAYATSTNYQPGTRWFGTDGGLNKMVWHRINGLDKYKPGFKKFTTNDGLAANKIHGIVEDENGFLWLGTDNGLSRFDPRTETFCNFYLEDGLPANHFTWHMAAFQNKKGRIFMGTVNGVVSFYPDSILANIKEYPVVFTDFTLFNKPVTKTYDNPLKKSITHTKKIELNHKQNYFSIGFTVIEYQVINRNQYRYMLKGVDENWIDAGENQTAVYQHIQPGKYIFMVKATNNNGVWNKEPKALEIIIHPPWWKTTIAYISYIILIFILIYSFVKWRTWRLRHEKEILEKLVEERTHQLKEHEEELIQQKEELQQTLDYLKETQAQLVQSEKMASIGQLTAGIAHEINNPVNYVSAGIESLNVNLSEIKQVLGMYHEITPANADEKLKVINEAKTRLDYHEALKEIDKLIGSIKAGSIRTTEIVKGLRAFSRLDEDELKQADIHEGIDLTLVMLHNKYKHHVEIVKEYGAIPLIECYPGKLNQVFMNILSNAIDAIEEKGIITIKTYKDQTNGMICISIIDTGKGMSEKEKAKIFDPFYTTKDVGKGTGLGLSISHGIIEQHRGLIEVISTVGKGTEFTISLPVKNS